MSRNDPIRSLVALSDDSRRIMTVVNDEPDLPAALITTSYLDACLRALLSSYFLQSSVVDRLLDSIRGPLGSLGNRADVAYTLGLIPKPLY